LEEVEMRISPSLAITKLKAIFVIDLIIVALAVGGYYYVQSLPPPIKKAEFQVTNLTVDPVEAGVGQPIIISANVTNLGEEAGNYSVNLTIDDVVKENKTVQLLGGTSEIVEFIVTKSNEGSYSVKIEELNGTFIITDMPLPTTLEISDLIISPYEAWVNEPIKISVKVSNIGDGAVSYPLAFRVNDAVRETRTIQLSAGGIITVNSTVTETSEGAYSVIVGGLTGNFKIVPTGKHTLKIYSAGSIPFTINGGSHYTPYSELLNVGMYTITFPEQYNFPTAVYQFVKWEDGSWNNTRTINLQSFMLLFAQYSTTRCCPSLYVWNGTNYVYRTEVSDGTGYLGILDYFREDGTMVFAYSYPWDYIKLDRSQLQPRNGYYDMTLTQVWDEISYIDSVQLLVVDHSPDVDVYSTKGTYIYNLEGQGRILSVSKNPVPPISCTNGEEDCLPQISKLDGIYTTGNEFHYDTLELNLGSLSDAEEIKLIVAGIIVYSKGEIQGEWAAKFVDQPGVKPFPPPYMEVKDENGNWVRVPENRQFPVLDVTSDCFVVNLTGIFPTNDYSLRINTFFDTRFDYIGVDITPQQNVTFHWIDLAGANLTQIRDTNSTSTGNFTRYGDVTPLLLEADDEVVIGRQGDQVHIKFNAADVGSVPENMERDFFLFASLWFKVPGLPYLDFTVDPLPFNDMSCFPYPPTESYPYEDHLSYLLEYNTRTITIPEERG
jgi:hypothetical protein